MTTPRFSARRVPALDGLRGFAALWVVAFHVYLCTAPTNRLGYAVELFMDRGWIGVQIFFVLSGYLITGILLDTANRPDYLPGFLFRRALRIFPVYYLTLVVFLVLLPALGLEPISLRESLRGAASHGSYARLGEWPLWLYFSNWVTPLGWPDHGLPHLWSLAVEEQFYLVWPFVCLLRDPRKVLWACLAVAFGCLLYRVVDGHALGQARMYLWTTCRADALGMGGAVAALQRMPDAQVFFRRIARHGLLLGGALLVVLALITKAMAPGAFVTQVWGPSLDSLAFALVIASMLREEPAHGLCRLLSTRPMRAVGTYSYAIYLFHKPIHDNVGLPLLQWLHVDLARSTLGSLAYTIALMLAVFLLAALSFHFFESPLLRLRDRVRGGRTGGPFPEKV